MSKAFLKIEDFTDAFQRSITSLKDEEVLIGIPSAQATRDPEKGGHEDINNAGILFINEYGSEDKKHPPARPVMKIGLKNAQDRLTEEFKKCAQSVLSKGPDAITNYFERAGIIASNSVKKAINDQDSIKAPAEATLAARKKAGFKGNKALVVTGQLRNAITYVVQSKKVF